MKPIIKVVGTAFTIISIITIIMLMPYLYKLTALNIQDINEGTTPTFSWVFIILTDLLPIILIIANIMMWKCIKKKDTKGAIVSIMIPIIYAVIITAYFLSLIL